MPTNYSRKWFAFDRRPGHSNSNNNNSSSEAIHCRTQCADAEVKLNFLELVGLCLWAANDDVELLKALLGFESLAVRTVEAYSKVEKNWRLIITLINIRCFWCVSYIVCPRNGWLTYPIQRSDAERKKIQKKIIVVESSECACVCARQPPMGTSNVNSGNDVGSYLKPNNDDVLPKKTQKQKFFSCSPFQLLQSCWPFCRMPLCVCECRTWTTDACA